MAKEKDTDITYKHFGSVFIGWFVFLGAIFYITYKISPIPVDAKFIIYFLIFLVAVSIVHVCFIWFEKPRYTKDNK
jgi:hypothetical protein